MTNTKADVLFHADLADREFGSALLSVEKLTAWAQDKDLELMTLPSLTGYRFVQAEALLCAIGRGVNNLTPEQAVAIVKADPVLSKHRAVTEPSGYVDPTTCRWLLGGDAHVSWRRLLESAIEKKELTLLNFASKLPINDEPGQHASPEPGPVVQVLTGKTEKTSTVTHTTKTSRRDTLTPVIELAQHECRNRRDTAEVWARLVVLAESKSPPLIGATEDGLQYLKNGTASIFKRDDLRKRLLR
jgi:hypothetical protein